MLGEIVGGGGGGGVCFYSLNMVMNAFIKLWVNCLNLFRWWGGVMFCLFDLSYIGHSSRFGSVVCVYSEGGLGLCLSSQT